MPDLSAGDNEPSMEDILASIRKIIADDKTESPAFDAEPEELSVLDVDAISEPESFSEKIEEQQFEIPEIEGTSQSFDETTPDTLEIPSENHSFEDEEILDLINFAENEVVVEAETDLVSDFEPATGETDLVSDFEPATGETETETETETSFDEGLDLVMDADATDYYSQSTESDENRLIREEIENDLVGEAETLAPEISSTYDNELVSTLDDLLEAPEIEDLLSTEPDDPQDVLSLDDDQADEVFSALDSPEFEGVEETIETYAADDQISEIDDPEDVMVPAPFSENNSNTEEDQDMDLVKSLLADLMDEPDETDFDETSFETAQDDADDTDNILDEILYQSMDDETTISEPIDDGAPQEESELAQIARNAREAAANPYHGTREIQAEDTLELPERNADNRLNLAATGGFVGVAAALVGSNEAAASDDLDAQVSQIVEEEVELEEIEELLDMIEETEAVSAETEQDDTDADLPAPESVVEEMQSPQEERKMVQAVKTEALLDEDIEQESSDAFAALSHVVQEKAELEENGPAIGDLVQDALRPMLKEWLDKNLKGIVERAVTKEVKRISAGK
jgi:cell pole-organizing protein PopZ